MSPDCPGAQKHERPVLAITPSEAQALLRSDPFDEQEAAIRAAERKQ